MASFASHLAETSSTWAQRVAPIAEWVAKSLSTSFSQSRRLGSPTLLTQQHRREAKGAPPRKTAQPPEPPRVCRSCGGELRRGQRCAGCGWASVADQPRQDPARPPAVIKRQAVMSRRSASAEAAWKPSDQPAWLTEQVYQNRFNRASLASARHDGRCSRSVETRCDRDSRGPSSPHPRHWLALAELSNVGGGR